MPSSARTSETGIRMAIGASRRDVVNMIFREAFLRSEAGFVIGIPVALTASRLIASRFLGVIPSDPVTRLFAAAALTLIALVAAYAPVGGPSQVDPLVALRSE
jgi:ABC-type antimicrobial peptide transport system permease subunit